jgi:hypothetical protein
MKLDHILTTFTSTLNTEATSSPETLVLPYKIIRCHNPQDHTHLLIIVMHSLDGVEWTSDSNEISYVLIEYRLPRTSQFIIREENIVSHHANIMTFRRMGWPVISLQIYVEFHSSNTLKAVWLLRIRAQCLALLGKQICCGQANAFCQPRQLWQ